jgi:hypothetical protein
VIKQDFSQLPRLIEEAAPKPAQQSNGQQDDEEPTQLSLF